MRKRIDEILKKQNQMLIEALTQSQAEKETED
jgi:hypothetical protein